MVRATLDRVQQRQRTPCKQDDKGGGTGVDGMYMQPMQRVMVVGSSEDPAFVLDADSQEVLWDRRLGKAAKQARPLVKSLMPYTGRIWCTESELHLILSHLRPFLRAPGTRRWVGGAGRTWGGDARGGEWEEVVMLEHECVRVEALYRYDNPGSITQQAIITEVQGSKAVGAAVQEEKQILVAHLDPHCLYGYSSSRDLRFAGYMGGPLVQTRYLTSGCKVDARVVSAVKVSHSGNMTRLQMAGMSEEHLQGDDSLRYLNSTLNSHDISTFFGSLDDNCVWHLYHFDQVCAVWDCQPLAWPTSETREPAPPCSSLLLPAPPCSSLLLLASRGDELVRHARGAGLVAVSRDAAVAGQVSRALSAGEQARQEARQPHALQALPQRQGPLASPRRRA